MAAHFRSPGFCESRFRTGYNRNIIRFELAAEQ